MIGTWREVGGQGSAVAGPPEEPVLDQLLVRVDDIQQGIRVHLMYTHEGHRDRRQ
jgi:hypothetical protein